MKYPVIIKLKYTFVSSSNCNEKRTLEYYQWFKNKKKSFLFSLISNVGNEKIVINHLEKECMIFTYDYDEYTNPSTKCKKTKLISKSYNLCKGKKITIKSVFKDYTFFGGYENKFASLQINWIPHEKFEKLLIRFAKNNKHKAIVLAKKLIEEQEYNLAYKILYATKLDSYELGLCYEYGYGTNIDLIKSLKVYLNGFGYDTDRSIERVVNKLQGKTIRIDAVKKTILCEQTGMHKKAYEYAVIPTSASDNSLIDIHRNVELSIIKFLELGKPYNDPFYHSTHTTASLSSYFDMINNVNDKVYHEVITEKDEYDGGTKDYDIVHKDRIIETLLNQARQNDVIALGVLLIQFTSDLNYPSYRLEFEDELEQRLKEVAITSSDEKSGMAYYFLGLYHKRETKQYEKSKEYFEISLEKGFHLSVVHLLDNIVKYDPKQALEVLLKHEPYIPFIRCSQTEKYYETLKKLKG